VPYSGKRLFYREAYVADEYTVEQFYTDIAEEFNIEPLTARLESPIPITVPDVHRPAFALTGFMENYLNERIQVIGETEVLYLRSLTREQQRDAIGRLFSRPLCCIIVTKGLELSEDFR
jgi:HPr kinase/phosphorylase